MKFPSIKLAAALLTAISMVCVGPAWSAVTAKSPTASATKHKVKAKKVKAKKLKATRVKAGLKSKHPAAATAAVSAVALVPAVAAAVPVAAAMPLATAQTGYAPTRPAVNPYLAYQQPMAPVNPADNARQIIGNIKAALPSLPEGQSLLPSIKKVYPTGEKPLVVVTFKCPTELIGITPIPTKILHDVVDGGMNVVNATNLLSFNLQQVCQ
jgi:hypothetical protein